MNFSSKTEWNAELARLKSYFSSIELPAQGAHKIDSATTIHDLHKAITTMLTRAEDNVGNPIFQGTLVGLHSIEKYLEESGVQKKA